jgi:2,3-dimethylmalate lyase
MKKTTKLRHLLERNEVLILPGSYDALGARVFEAAEFDAVYLSGNSTAASMLGVPDIGLMTATEVIWRAHRMASAVEIPLICDADTGYGNLHNVMRTVRDFEAAGVAGIHLEDQITPKKCGSLPGVEVLSLEEALIKFEAALRARSDPDFLIIARTDARTAINLDEAITRGRAYAELGVDLVYIEGLRSLEEIQEVACRLKDVPRYLSVTEWRPWTNLSLNEIKELGFKVAMFSNSLNLIITKAMQNFAKHLKEYGNTKGIVHLMADLHKDYNDDILGLKHYNETESLIVNKIRDR